MERDLDNIAYVRMGESVVGGRLHTWTGDENFARRTRH